MQATDLQALARQPQRIAGARLTRSPNGLSRAVPGLSLIGSLACAATATVLLLVADPTPVQSQIAFYSAATAAGFMAGLAAAWRWARGRAENPALVRPWRAGVIGGLVVAVAIGLGFAGLRVGLGPAAILPPVVLAAMIAGIRSRLRPR